MQLNLVTITKGFSLGKTRSFMFVTTNYTYSQAKRKVAPIVKIVLAWVADMYDFGIDDAPCFAYEFTIVFIRELKPTFSCF